jgi:ABC-type enterochelin transport system ATPase subunit
MEALIVSQKPSNILVNENCDLKVCRRILETSTHLTIDYDRSVISVLHEFRTRR